MYNDNNAIDEQLKWTGVNCDNVIREAHFTGFSATFE